MEKKIRSILNCTFTFQISEGESNIFYDILKGSLTRLTNKKRVEVFLYLFSDVQVWQSVPTSFHVRAASGESYFYI